MSPKKPVRSLVDFAIDNIADLVRDEALRVAYVVRNKLTYEEVPGTPGYDPDLEEKLAADREIYYTDQVELFKQHFLSHIPHLLVEEVLRSVLVGIAQAILALKKEWTPATNMKFFTRKIYAVTKFSNVLVIPYRKTLNLDKIPKVGKQIQGLSLRVCFLKVLTYRPV